MTPQSYLRAVVLDAAAHGRPLGATLLDAADHTEALPPAARESARWAARRAEAGELAPCMLKLGFEAPLADVAAASPEAIVGCEGRLRTLWSPDDKLRELGSVAFYGAIVLAVERMTLSVLAAFVFPVLDKITGDTAVNPMLQTAVWLAALLLIIMAVALLVPRARRRITPLLFPELARAREFIGAAALCDAGLPASQAMAATGCEAAILRSETKDGLVGKDAALLDEASLALAGRAARRAHRLNLVGSVLVVATAVLLGLFIVLGTYSQIFVVGNP